MSLNFSQFEDIGKLPNLRQLSLVRLKRSGKAGLVLLENRKWQGGARRSAFQFLQKLTSLELGAHRQAPVTPEEYEGLSHLTDLQHINLQWRPFPSPTSGQIPYSILRKLSALTSLEVEELQHGISQLTSLESLSIPSGGPFHFTEDFSGLQGLTALAVGPNPARQGWNVLSYPVMVVRDLLSLRVFSSLQNLTLTGMMGFYVPAGGTEQAALWEGLATLTSVKHLEL